VYERRFEILGILPTKLGNKPLHGSGPSDAMALFAGNRFFSAGTRGVFSVNCRNPHQEKSSERG
jgi:hypothetical protein